VGLINLDVYVGACGGFEIAFRTFVINLFGIDYCMDFTSWSIHSFFCYFVWTWTFGWLM